jgi:hypothetical protein
VDRLKQESRSVMRGRSRGQTWHRGTQRSAPAAAPPASPVARETFKTVRLTALLRKPRPVA